MKMFQSTEEWIWTEYFTEGSRPVTDESEKIILDEFYSSVKPTLEEGDVYQLISMDMLDITDSESGKFTGILNCRVNGEQDQIRF